MNIVPWILVSSNHPKDETEIFIKINFFCFLLMPHYRNSLSVVITLKANFQDKHLCCYGLPTGFYRDNGMSQ
jgi:hypothetical protein